MMRPDALGGFVTKAVSLEPRHGAPAPRVAEFDGGMINAVGLANPGLDAVRREQLPWLAAHLPATRKIVNVVGFTVDEYPAVVAGIEESLAARQRGGGRRVRAQRELPEREGGRTWSSAPIRRRCARWSTARDARRRGPSFVKLSPTLPNIGDAARIAADAGADAISVVNTIPGLVIDVERRRPALGFGTGGVSGPAILPVGVLATWKVRKARCRSRSSASAASRLRRTRCSTSSPARRSSAWERRRCAIRARRSASSTGWRRGAAGTACTTSKP